MKPRAYQFWLLVIILLVAIERPALAQSLTLREAISIAERNSPIAIAAAERVNEAAAKAQQAQAMFMPMLKITSSYSQSDNPVQVFMYALNQGKFALSPNLNDPGVADNWVISGQAGLRLFNGGRDWANRAAANAAKRGMINVEAATLDELRIQVTRSYLLVLTATEYVRSAEASVLSYESNEQVLTDRVAAGTTLKTELLNVQVQKARAEERLLQARNGLALAREGLGLLLGSDSLGYSDFGTLDEVRIAEPSAAKRGDNPAVLAKSAFADAARAQLRAAKGGYLPSLNAFASIDRYQGWEFDGTESSWSAGLMLEWTLFDGLFTPGVVKEKRANFEAAKEDARQARLQASVEVTSASFNLDESNQRVAVMERAVELAKESAALTGQRFAQGLAISDNVINAQDALVQAEFGLAQAKADRLFAIAALRRALAMPIIGDPQS